MGNWKRAKNSILKQQDWNGSTVVTPARRTGWGELPELPAVRKESQGFGIKWGEAGDSIAEERREEDSQDAMQHLREQVRILAVVYRIDSD